MRDAASRGRRSGRIGGQPAGPGLGRGGSRTLPAPPAHRARLAVGALRGAAARRRQRAPRRTGPRRASRRLGPGPRAGPQARGGRGVRCAARGPGGRTRTGEPQGGTRRPGVPGPGPDRRNAPRLRRTLAGRPVPLPGRGDSRGPAGRTGRTRPRRRRDQRRRRTLGGGRLRTGPGRGAPRRAGRRTGLAPPGTRAPDPPSLPRLPRFPAAPTGRGAPRSGPGGSGRRGRFRNGRPPIGRAGTGAPRTDRRRRGAELLVVGARRSSGWHGLQLGPVNHAVLHYAPCPVAVVPDTYRG